MSRLDPLTLLGSPSPGDLGEGYNASFADSTPKQLVTAHSIKKVVVDARSLIFQEIAERGIGSYSEQHLRAVGQALHKRGASLTLATDCEQPVPILEKLRNMRGIEIISWFTSDRISCDIYHILDQMTPIYGYDSPLIAAPPTVPISVTFYDLIPLAIREQHFDAWPPNLQSLYVRRLREVQLSNAAMLTISQATANDLSKMLGLPSSRLFPILGGVRARVQDLDSAEARQTDIYQNQFGEPYFLVVGGLEKHKNFDKTFDGFVAHCQAGLPGKLVVVGSFVDPLKNHYAQEANKIVPGRVVFTGYIEAQELDTLYHGATALLFPSSYEGFGFPAVEAMLRGCPVVVGNASSLPEIVGDAGVVLDEISPLTLKVAMGRLLQDRALRDD